MFKPKNWYFSIIPGAEPSHPQIFHVISPYRKRKPKQYNIDEGSSAKEATAA